MNSSDPIQLLLEISASDATDNELDRMTRQLLSEIKETDVESAELTKGGRAPQGPKGDPMTKGMTHHSTLLSCSRPKKGDGYV